jgi:hypothetical protein
MLRWLVTPMIRGAACESELATGLSSVGIADAKCARRYLFTIVGLFVLVGDTSEFVPGKVVVFWSELGVAGGVDVVLVVLCVVVFFLSLLAIALAPSASCRRSLVPGVLAREAHLRTEVVTC